MFFAYIYDDCDVPGEIRRYKKLSNTAYKEMQMSYLWDVLPYYVFNTQNLEPVSDDGRKRYCITYEMLLDAVPEIEDREIFPLLRDLSKAMVTQEGYMPIYDELRIYHMEALQKLADILGMPLNN